MTNKQKRILKEIRKKSIHLDWEVAFEGKSKGNRHLFRVTKIAEALQKKEGGNKFVILAGAWMHDIALAFGDDRDGKTVESIASNFLKQFDINKSTRKIITEAVSWHENPKENQSIEARIIHDSDVIDKGGMLGVIRHTWKMTNLLEKRILSGTKDLEILKNHLRLRKSRLFTDTAKTITKSLDKSVKVFFQDRKLACNTMNLISNRAFEGNTSDKIALILCNSTNLVETKALKDQLRCKYLSKL